MLSPFFLANSHAAATCLRPAGSMAWGFSTKTCLPASMAAFVWSGWNLPAFAMSTASALSMTPL